MAVLKNQAVSWCINDDYQSEMFNSVKVGADSSEAGLRSLFYPAGGYSPGSDHQTLQLLMGFCGKDPRQIVYPTFLGERGHPPLIPRQYAGELTRWAGKGGLKGFLESYDHRSLDVPVL